MQPEAAPIGDGPVGIGAASASGSFVSIEESLER
jgi:hypothetical protein